MSGSQKHKWKIHDENIRHTWFQEDQHGLITPARRHDEDQKQFRSTLKNSIEIKEHHGNTKLHCKKINELLVDLYCKYCRIVHCSQ